MSQPQGDLTLDELKALFGMSVRAYNACRNADLHGLQALIDYRNTYGGFLHLRNCGVTTRRELEELLEFAQGRRPAQAVEQGDGTSADGRTLESWFQSRFTALSRRAQFALLGVIGEPVADKAIAFYRQPEPSFPRLKGSRTRIQRELRMFGEKLLATADKLTREERLMMNQSSSTKAPEGLVNWLLLNRLPTTLQDALVNAAGEPTLLRFAGRLREHQPLAAPKKMVFDAYAKGPSGDVDLEQLARMTGLTRERVRQFVKGIEDEIVLFTGIMAAAPWPRERYPGLWLREVVEPVSMVKVQQLNAIDGTNWSPLFYLHLIKALNHPRYSRLSWRELGWDGSKSGAMDRMLPILILETLKAPLLEAYFKVLNRIEERRSTAVKLDPRLFLSEQPSHVQYLLGPALVDLLSVTHGVLIQEDGLLLLPINTSMGGDEMLEALLNRIDRPATANELVAAWNSEFVDQPMHAAGIRYLVRRYPHKFFSIGRSSTYGLRRWESERPNMKGGTIRGIVREFLLKADRPMPMSAVMEEVLRYRQTNRSSVLTNLQLCEPEQFVFLSGDRIALVGTVLEEEIAPDLTTERLPLRKQDIRRFAGQPVAALRAYLIDKLHHTEAEADRVIASRRSSGKLVVDVLGIIQDKRGA